jgi:hypothetical protein
MLVCLTLYGESTFNNSQLFLQTVFDPHERPDSDLSKSASTFGAAYFFTPTTRGPRLPKVVAHTHSELPFGRMAQVTRCWLCDVGGDCARGELE